MLVLVKRIYCGVRRLKVVIELSAIDSAFFDDVVFYFTRVDGNK